MPLAWPPMQACIYSYPIGRVAIATIVLKTEQPQSYRLSHCSLEPGLIGNNETAGWYASTNRDRSVEPPGETRRRGYACVRTRACEILRPMQNPTERPRVRHARARARKVTCLHLYTLHTQEKMGLSCSSALRDLAFFSSPRFFPLFLLFSFFSPSRLNWLYHLLSTERHPYACDAARRGWRGSR